MIWGRIPSLLAAAALSLPCVLSATPAQAEPSAAEVAVARKLFKEATALEKEKKWDVAEEKLRKAVAIKDTPGLRYHLAFCLEQQGKLVDAMVEYDRADEMIKAGNKAPDVEQLIVSARDSLKERIPTITVKLPADVQDAVIEVDGRGVSAAVAGQALPQNPGKHTVKVSAPGHRTFVQEVRLGEKERRELAVALVPAASDAPAPATTSGSDPTQDSGSVSTDSSGWSTRTWVLVGEGAVVAIGLGLGIFATLDRGKAEDQVDAAHDEIERLGTRKGDSACVNPEPEDKNACEQLPGLLDQVSNAKTLQTIGFVSAGVGLAAGAATFLLWKPESKAEAAKRPRVFATPTRGGAFVGVGASF